MKLLTTLTSKLVSGLVALAVIVSAISWWQMDPTTRHLLVSGTGKILAWLGIVAVVPWATFFAIARVGRMDSNLAGAILVAGYTLLEALLLAWLFDWAFPGRTAWSFYTVGILLAVVYNVLVCDWIAEKAE